VNLMGGAKCFKNIHLTIGKIMKKNKHFKIVFPENVLAKNDGIK